MPMADYEGNGMLLVPRRLLGIVSTRQDGTVGFSFVPRDLDMASVNLLRLGW